MNFLKIACISLLALFMAGCETIKVVVVEKNSWKTVSVDPVLLEDCKIEPTVTRPEYLKMSMDEREDHLTRLVIEQYKHTKNCTTDKRSIKTSLEKQKALIDEYNDKEEKRVLEEKKALEK